MKLSKRITFSLLAVWCCFNALTTKAQDPPAAAPPEAARQLTLAECLQTGVGNHPMLLAAATRVQGAEEVRKYAGERPNPVLTLQSENWRVTGSPTFAPGRDLDLFIFGTQTIEMAGKAARRTELASRSVSFYETESKAIRWRLQQDITRAYFRALEAQAAYESALGNRPMLTSLVEYAGQRVKEGFAPESELVRAKLEQQTLENQEAKAALDLERAKLDLLRAIGATSFDTKFMLVAGNSSPDAVPFVELERVAIAERPDLLTLRAKLEQTQAALRLAQADLRPDIDLSLGYKRTGSYNTMIATVAIPLAIHKRKQGTVGQIAAEVTALESDLKSLENYIKADLANTHQTINRLAERLRTMQPDYLKNAEDARDIALLAYREGVHDLYKVLDAQRARNEAMLLNMKTRIELQAAQAELTLATGKELK